MQEELDRHPTGRGIRRRRAGEGKIIKQRELRIRPELLEIFCRIATGDVGRPANGQTHGQSRLAKIEIINRYISRERFTQPGNNDGDCGLRFDKRIDFKNPCLVGLEGLEQRDRLLAGFLVPLDFALDRSGLMVDIPQLPFGESKIDGQRYREQDSHAIDEERRAHRLDIRQFFIIAEIRVPSRHGRGDGRVTFSLQT